jgi:NAD-dependent deacetylase
VHGSIRRSVCLTCGHELLLPAVLAQLEEREAPVCTECGAILKPGVVMFGELLPAAAAARAEQLARGAALLLVVGSSLQVWPAAGWPAQTLGAGGAVAVVNRDETPYDRDAILTVREAAGASLAEARRLLLES